MNGRRQGGEAGNEPVQAGSPRRFPNGSSLERHDHAKQKPLIDTRSLWLRRMADFLIDWLRLKEGRDALKMKRRHVNRQSVAKFIHENQRITCVQLEQGLSIVSAAMQTIIHYHLFPTQIPNAAQTD
ncbi:hypothetical protein EVAR_94408_1 [Eumeta japonica]|uniref:Uncharacterized protein n=1 Tax=Eumeta variegata TaxID=151549 RepID=A0A4C1TQ40_EUMVA|nr:hypothetical protein EVAR_94408_1 [Eumeta japonica]